VKLRNFLSSFEWIKKETSNIYMIPKLEKKNNEHALELEILFVTFLETIRSKNRFSNREE
jgi:hypothetical protein